MEGVYCYMNDILVVSWSEIEYNQTLEEVLKWARAENLKLIKSKKRIGAKQINYLGYTISEEKISI